jgi:hypothetical protein
MLDFLAKTLVPGLLALWPAVLAVALIAAIGARADGSSSGRWRGIARLAVLFSLVTCLFLALREAAIPVNNRLTRDIVAFAVIGFVGPAISYVCAFARGEAPTWLRAALSLIAGFVPLVISPLMLLFVHCTSGDCL